ncbi:hypothetical protein AB0D08_37385 [Kitasatospora sp. NPDC048540]|uniref:hypothetical protein n=1 Tax=Kitasatospora sp. NPDC048540 TaxID=3155634 RepID=UPI0033D86778
MSGPAGTLPSTDDLPDPDSEPHAAGRPAADTPEADGPPAPWSADDDWTDETLALLREMRAPHRRGRARQIGFAVYCALLVLVVWGVTPSFGLLLQSSMGADYTAHGRAILAALPSGVAALSLATLLLAARDGLWRGPVVPPRAATDWLLAHPLRPRRVLRPWFWLSAGLATVPGVLAAAGAMVVLALTVPAGLPAAFGWCLLGGVCVPLLATCLGLAVELDDRVAAAVRRLTPYVTVVVLLLTAQSVLAARGQRIGWLERGELWSGPWGWAGLAALAPTPAARAGAWAAAGLLLAVTAVCVVLADRACGNVPVGRLRERARTAAGVLAALRTVELRAARLAVSGSAPSAVMRLRLPAPRAPWLAVPWRDALALLRSPARPGRAVLLTVPAVGCAALVPSATGLARWGGTALALVFGYLAVAQLLEPARIETDDVRRASWSPYPVAGLMLRHAVVPTVLGVLAGLAGAGAAVAAGAGARVWLVPVAVPALVGAGLVNACRGFVRRDLMYGGASRTPGSGGGGPVLFLAWYAAGPAVAVVVLAAPFGKALAEGSGLSVLGAAAWSAVCAAVLLGWARQRAGQLRATARS